MVDSKLMYKFNTGKIDAQAFCWASYEECACEKKILAALACNMYVGLSYVLELPHGLLNIKRFMHIENKQPKCKFHINSAQIEGKIM